MTEPWEDWTLWEWDWGMTSYGRMLHHVKDLDLNPEYDSTAGNGHTSCGRRLWLMIPGIMTRMGAERCGRCCEALGYPLGRGSPKNDDRCRELVETRIMEARLS